jgi:hypothetical protein
MTMEEDRILARFHQQFQKERDKAWHDRHMMKKKTFKEGDIVLMYDIKLFQHPRKIKMHWLGPYEVKFVIDGGVLHLRDSSGAELKGMINGI